MHILIMRINFADNLKDKQESKQYNGRDNIEGVTGNEYGESTNENTEYHSGIGSIRGRHEFVKNVNGHMGDRNIGNVRSGSNRLEVYNDLLNRYAKIEMLRKMIAKELKGNK